jgi:hypothetical protein
MSVQLYVKLRTVQEPTMGAGNTPVSRNSVAIGTYANNGNFLSAPINAGLSTTGPRRSSANYSLSVLDDKKGIRLRKATTVDTTIYPVQKVFERDETIENVFVEAFLNQV